MQSFRLSTGGRSVNVRAIHLLLRVDATPEIGHGHLMRCLALTEAWCREEGTATIVTRALADRLMSRIEASGTKCVVIPGARSTVAEELGSIQHCVNATNSEWVVLDGYHFDPEYQVAVKSMGVRTLVIDDYAHLPAYHCDVILNQNLGAEGFQYCRDADTALLLGPRYALLRDEFANRKPDTRPAPAAITRVLIAFGGGDPQNMTGLIMESLPRRLEPGLQFTAVVGSGNPHTSALRASAECQPNIKLCYDVGTQMPELMAEADIALSSASTTCWELAFMGLPAIVVECAENQVALARQLELAGLAVNLGWHGAVSADSLAAAVRRLMNAPDERRRMSQRGRSLVDGRGRNRVISGMMRRAEASRYEKRPTDQHARE
jgi:UDP-2,4-diacetamido-2,4,6-trideoxy-beta-L-altropyranose hydrolase